MSVQHSIAARLFTKCSNLFAKSILCRLYSENHHAPPRRRNWHLEGHVAPPTLVQQQQHSADSLDLSEDEPPPPRRRTRPDTTVTPGHWKSHRDRIKEMFPEGWNPERKVSREAMEALRSLHALDNETFTTPLLASKFKISPEAVRRILRSKWEPSKEKRAKLAERERKDREERVVRSRIEEKKKKIEILLETKNTQHIGDKPTGRKVQRPRRSSSVKDELFFR
ncbi:hypothetical protein SCLCIDRAFT_1206918 [Scleroderma citrinum Foug A]|uniref:Required for respiratory growth protein 9, mitochondrial n=1 Tax=Scleroderma citrinum Foug A TaxID=1036808 RepID=A0A0C3AAF7_9AGAM|nr:hypothetical protein SCLCIDRAFT_1206918 [Scleroderma citrinum Foug A]